MKQSITDYCAQYGFRCRFLFESVIITTPIADWSFGYHERLKTLRHESTTKINFKTGDYAKTHEQFANRKMTCFEVIDYTGTDLTISYIAFGDFSYYTTNRNAALCGYGGFGHPAVRFDRVGSVFLYCKCSVEGVFILLSSRAAVHLCNQNTNDIITRWICVRHIIAAHDQWRQKQKENSNDSSYHP